MELEKIVKVRKRVNRILAYSLVASLFVIVGVGMGYKFAKKPFYFYNRRYDVVLTDSMSEKNEKYQDFLKDTEQIQAFDFVVSEKISDDTKLNVLDVVIFDNPDIGIDMHRIVEVEQVGDVFQLNNLSEEKVGEIDTFKFVSPTSSIVLEKTFIYTDVEIVTYTQDAYDESEYYFNVDGISINPTIASTLEANGYYRNVITYHRDSARPTTFSITKQSYEYLSHFEYIKLSGGNSNILINSNIVKQAENSKYMFNVNERYLIRGDKANTDDGWYERPQLDAKVVRVIPKFGYPMRFLSTPYGAIMIIGLMFIPIVYWVFFEKKPKKEKQQKKEGEENAK